jgi:hypothetical protein
MDGIGVAMMDALLSSLWLLVPLSASFNAFFLFDMVGDEIGFGHALAWMIPFAVLAPLLVWACYVLTCIALKQEAADVNEGHNGPSHSPRQSSDRSTPIDMAEQGAEGDVGGISLAIFNEQFTHDDANVLNGGNAPQAMTMRNRSSMSSSPSESARPSDTSGGINNPMMMEDRISQLLTQALIQHQSDQYPPGMKLQ